MRYGSITLKSAVGGAEGPEGLVALSGEPGVGLTLEGSKLGCDVGRVAGHILSLGIIIAAIKTRGFRRKPAVVENL